MNPKDETVFEILVENFVVCFRRVKTFYRIVSVKKQNRPSHTKHSIFNFLPEMRLLIRDVDIFFTARISRNEPQRSTRVHNYEQVDSYLHAQSGQNRHCRMLILHGPFKVRVNKKGSKVDREDLWAGLMFGFKTNVKAPFCVSRYTCPTGRCIDIYLDLGNNLINHSVKILMYHGYIAPWVLRTHTSKSLYAHAHL